jgi:hypothetical protein
MQVVPDGWDKSTDLYTIPLYFSEQGLREVINTRTHKHTHTHTHTHAHTHTLHTIHKYLIRREDHQNFSKHTHTHKYIYAYISRMHVYTHSHTHTIKTTHACLICRKHHEHFSSEGLGEVMAHQRQIRVCSKVSKVVSRARNVSFDQSSGGLLERLWHRYVSVMPGYTLPTTLLT